MLAECQISDAVPELATAGVAASLRSRDFQAQVFGKTFANFLGQAVMYMACPKLGRIHNGHWRGSRHGHRQPDQGGKREAAQRGNFQPESMPWPEMPNHTEGKQEHSSRNRS